MMLCREWYIVETGGSSSIVDFDTCMSITYDTSATLPTKTVENGSFFTANKWTNPFDVTVVLARASRDGSGSDLHEVLSTLEYWKNSVRLVDVVTPYRTFIHANISKLLYSFDNSKDGVGVIVPTISLKEVRLVNTSLSTSGIIPAGAKNPDCATTPDSGRRSANETGEPIYA